jgi:hypothetical protein
MPYLIVDDRLWRGKEEDGDVSVNRKQKKLIGEQFLHSWTPQLVKVIGMDWTTIYLGILLNLLCLIRTKRK